MHTFHRWHRLCSTVPLSANPLPPVAVGTLSDFPFIFLSSMRLYLYQDELFMLHEMSQTVGKPGPGHTTKASDDTHTQLLNLRGLGGRSFSQH